MIVSSAKLRVFLTSAVLQHDQGAAEGSPLPANRQASNKRQQLTQFPLLSRHTWPNLPYAGPLTSILAPARIPNIRYSR